MDLQSPRPVLVHRWSPGLQLCQFLPGCHWLRQCFAGISIFSLSLGWTSGTVTAEPTATLYPVEGEPYSAAIAKINAGDKLELNVDGKSRTIALSQLVRWGSFREATRGPQVLLVGDGLIVADEVRIA